MDLKHAWRNGFLVSVIFALPLSDLYIGQFSNLIVENSAGSGRGEHTRTGICRTNAPCTNRNDARIADNTDKLSGVPSTWDNGVDENNRTSPGNILADLLPESVDTDLGNLQQAVVPFDPQDEFLYEPIHDFDAGIFGKPLQSDTGIFGSNYAPGIVGSFSPPMFPGAGQSANAGLQNASTEDSALPFIDPVRESLAQTETADSINTTSETIPLGTGDNSMHNVPEPSSFVLIAIGTLSVATLLFRKSKRPTQIS